MTDTPAVLHNGDWFIYRIKAYNEGPALATDVVVKDIPLPAGMEMINYWTDTGLVSPQPIGSEVTWTIGDLVAGAPAKILDIAVRFDNNEEIDPIWALDEEVCNIGNILPNEVVLTYNGTSLPDKNLDNNEEDECLQYTCGEKECAGKIYADDFVREVNHL